MAEQEACTELVKQASQDQSRQSIDGESLLLPLLQGLLDAPENEQTHDSGTESGEDQRSGLIAEVQNALQKLSLSLQSDTTDITPERRSSLLQLVTKLQAGLCSATSDRRHNSQIRFNRRRERPDRHTVGVSSEELADARRLIEEISCPKLSSTLLKQNSESNVNQHGCSYTSVNQIHQKSTVKNSTPKPFSCSNSASVSSNSSSVQTPSESVDFIGNLFCEDNNNGSLNHSPITQDNIENEYNRTQNLTPDLFSKRCTENAMQKQIHITESEEDDSSTIKTLDIYPQPDLVMQSNPLYYRPDAEEVITDKKNRFATKKLKMRRANTIDIPKPLHFYEYDDEETDYEEEDKRRRNNYLALRGPIRIGNIENRKSMPILEPKTDNDKKFLAFINKHNEKNQRHSLWANNAERSSLWNNKFDHIKTNFEKRTDSLSPNSARNFWKESENSVRCGSNKYDPKISRESARNLKRMFEEKQKQNNTYESIVRPSGLAENVQRSTQQPLPVNKFSHAPSSAFQPVCRNFSQEASQQKIIPKPLEISKSIMNVNDSQGNQRLFLYSPKPLQNIENNSPTYPNTKPWVCNTGDSRVLTLAAKKFENPAPLPVNSFQPRKLSREKIVGIPNFQENTSEKLTAPFLVKSLNQGSNTVRKLSDQYDNLGSQNNKSDTFLQYKNVPENGKHIDGFQARFTIPQNYSIRYDRPNLMTSQTDNSMKFTQCQQTSPSQVKKYNYSAHNNEKALNKPTDFSVNKNVPRISSYPKSNEQYVSQEYKPLQESKNNNFGHNFGISSNSVVTPTYNRIHSSENFRRPQEQPNYQAETLVSTQIYNGQYDTKPKISISGPSRPPYRSQVSEESLKEYNAINSQVMKGPVAQVASTVRQKSPMTRNEHDMEAAFALKNTLQRVSTSTSPNPQQQPVPSSTESSNKFQLAPNIIGRPNAVEKEITNQSRKTNQQTSDSSTKYSSSQNYVPPLSEYHITDRGEHIVTGKFPIPAMNIKAPPVSSSKPSHAQILSKSDSWNQICLMNQGTAQLKPSPRSSLNNKNIMKSKSTHCMIPPKQFEAGMTKEEIAEKKRTLEAFFGGGTTTQSTAHSPTGGKVVKRSINRTKTSEKNAQYKQAQGVGLGTGLARSRTLPDIVCPDLLDESNVDKAFEDLFSSS